jgi:uncharacterized membrane protein SpoIIM required for sporulation
MRESKFIKQNKEKWSEFETLFEEKNKDSNKLSKLFIQITDDLSYARTYYPNRSVRYYINELAQKVFSTIYKKPKRKKGAISYFLFEEMPSIIYESRFNFFVTLFFFFTAFSIGFVSSHYDKDFPEQILGSEYIEMTKDNIAKKDPMAVYKQEDDNKFMMAFRITINNIKVACYAFISGIFFGLGTLYIMLSNGIMLGAFEYLFFDAKIMGEAFLAVFLHGMLEISSIVIAGAAGLTLANGLIFPGTFTRMQALQISGQKGLKILFTTIPLFIMAGTIEGFLTRYTDIPDGIRLFFILLCLVFILGYYVWLPFQRWRSGKLVPTTNEKVITLSKKQIQLYEIKEIGTIFSQTFQVYQQYLNKLFNFGLKISIIYTLVCFAFYKLSNHEEQFLSHFLLDNMELSFHYYEPNLFIILNILLICLSIFYSFYIFQKIINSSFESQSFLNFIVNNKMLLLLTFICSFLINLYFFSPTGILYLLCLSPILLLFTGLHGYKNTKEQAFSELIKGYKQSFSNFINVLFIYLIMAFMASLIYIASLILGSFFTNIILTNLPESWKNAQSFAAINFFFFSSFPILIATPLFVISQGFLYYCHKEKFESISLSVKLSNLGKKRDKYGF